MSEFSLTDKPEPRPIWVLMLGIVIMGVWMVLEAPAALKEAGPANAASADFHDTAVYYAGLAGWVTVPALIIWAITYVAFMRHRAPSASYLLVLIVVGVACTVATAHRAMKEDQVAAIDRKLAAAVAADDEVNDSEIKKLGIGGVADPERLLNAKAAAAARSKISEARRVIDKYHELTGSRLITARGELLRIAPRSDAVRKERQDVLASIRDGEAKRDDQWRRQRAILDEADDSITFLERTRGSWRFTPEGKMLFTDPAILAAYRAHAEKFHKLIADADPANPAASIGAPSSGR